MNLSLNKRKNNKCRIYLAVHELKKSDILGTLEKCNAVCRSSGTRHAVTSFTLYSKQMALIYNIQNEDVLEVNNIYGLGPNKNET